MIETRDYTDLAMTATFSKRDVKASVPEHYCTPIPNCVKDYVP